MKYFFMALLLILSSCNTRKSTENLVLPILNIAEDDYPTRKLNIYDIADVEYVPLESSDSTLLGNAIIYASDKYLVTSDGITGGNIYFFDHSGKLLWKFNKKGSGPGEFGCLDLAIVDFEEEECYVNDDIKKQMQIYSFKGVFKRSISLAASGKGLESIVAYTKILNYNKEYMIGYDNAAVYFLRELPNKPPYYLINKKSGSRQPLDLKICNGITNQIFDNNGERIGALTHFPLLQNGNECWIAELSSDTIYSLVNNQLVPIAVQTPSVHSTNPPLAIFPYGFNDYFLVFDVASLAIDEKNPRWPKHRKPLVWNRVLGRLERWELYNSDITSSNNSISVPIAPYNIMSGTGAIYHYSADELINFYKKGFLKGRLKDIASTLKEDDNKLIMLVKYKKNKIWKILAE